jgi:hypothetical protein
MTETLCQKDRRPSQSRTSFDDPSANIRRLLLGRRDTTRQKAPPTLVGTPAGGGSVNNILADGALRASNAAAAARIENVRAVAEPAIGATDPVSPAAAKENAGGGSLLQGGALVALFPRNAETGQP